MKFEFLRVVCYHEHYIPLNLPFACSAKSHKNGKFLMLAKNFVYTVKYGMYCILRMQESTILTFKTRSLPMICYFIQILEWDIFKESVEFIVVL